MRIPIEPALPIDQDWGQFRRRFYDIWRVLALQINNMSDGYVSAMDTARTSAPIVGTWNQGDYVRKSNVVESGPIGTKYVIKGWIRATSGTGNTLGTDWLEDRALTGN